jgi:hypothetical protein
MMVAAALDREQGSETVKLERIAAGSAASATV